MSNKISCRTFDNVLKKSSKVTVRGVMEPNSGEYTYTLSIYTISIKSDDENYNYSKRQL